MTHIKEFYIVVLTLKVLHPSYYNLQVKNITLFNDDFPLLGS
jgi:hypothetical protein